MQIEAILVIVSLSGTVIVGVGLMKTWRRNGVDQRERDVELAKERAERDARLEGKVDQLHTMSNLHLARTTEVKKEVAAMATHCAGTVAGFKEKHTSTERRLSNLEADAH